VSQEAKQHNRASKVSFADTDFSPKYDEKACTTRIKEAEERGCHYFVIGFWQNNCLDSMQQFARDIIPSFG